MIGCNCILLMMMKKENTTNQLRRSLSEISAIMYKIYVKWWVSARPMKESERIAGNMYRMMIFKAKSIWLMTKGIIIVRTQKGIIPLLCIPYLEACTNCCSFSGACSLIQKMIKNANYCLTYGK